MIKEILAHLQNYHTGRTRDSTRAVLHSQTLTFLQSLTRGRFRCWQTNLIDKEEIVRETHSHYCQPELFAGDSTQCKYKAVEEVSVTGRRLVRRRGSCC